MNDAPKLLVEWSSPWREFCSAIRPALARSPRRLAGEAQTGLFPYQGMLASWAIEALLLIAAIVLPEKLESMHPYQPLPMPKYDVIYFSGDELPRTEDLGGAESGRSGRSGGQEAHHRTQTIRVARGNSLRDTVVDAPKLNLPISNSPVANLLAYRPVPGPAPAEGLQASLRAPTLPQTVVPPAPQIQRDNLPAAPALNSSIIAPAPDVHQDRMHSAPALVSNVISPPPDVQRDKMQVAPVLDPSVVAPSVAVPQRDVVAMRVPGSQVTEVVPPPVSAPERPASLNPRLTLPAQTVVTPPPTVTREIASLGPGFGVGDLHQQVVPPPVQVGGTSGERRTMDGLGTTSVVPPAVQLSMGSAPRQPGGGLGGSLAGLTGVVPPAPSVSGSSSLGGQGRGNRGAGLGGLLDRGSIVAPPNSGSGNGTGVVVSNQPGSAVGVPGNGGSGALAMSPSGGNKPGLGGSGGGLGIGRGDGPGSGFSGAGPGAGKAGAGRGSDTTAHGGISPYPGPGGAGSEASGSPAMPGVSVKGGSSNVVTLPSFGADRNQPGAPGRSNTGPDRNGPGITVVASSRSGGAFNFYGALKGDKVYTIYIETALGTAVMQYADPDSGAHPYAEDLVAPQPMHADLPAGLPKARLVIACILDRSGLVRHPQVLEPSSAAMTSKVLAALNSWKFRPVLRGSQPIEVNAILGFNIDTNDRF